MPKSSENSETVTKYQTSKTLWLQKNTEQTKNKTNIDFDKSEQLALTFECLWNAFCIVTAIACRARLHTAGAQETHSPDRQGEDWPQKIWGSHLAS